MPPNDAFVDAIALKPGRVQGSNTLATRELGEPAVAEGGGGSVWYRYRTNTRQRVTLDTSNSSFDTVLGVFTGDLGTLRKIASNDDGGVADTSLLSFTAVPRRTYWILVDGFESGRGSFEVGLSDGSIAGYGVTLAEPQSTDLLDRPRARAAHDGRLPPRVQPGAAGPRVADDGAPDRPAAQRRRGAGPDERPPARRRQRRRRRPALLPRRGAR